MNKYQDALEYMKANAVQEITNSYFRKHKALDGINFEEFDNNLTTLQELVDKETPKKVLIVNDEYVCPGCLNGDRLSTYERECYPHYDNPRCGECGQALDWNDDEPTK